MLSQDVRPIRLRMGWTQLRLEEWLGSAAHRVSFWECNPGVVLHKFFNDQMEILRVASYRKSKRFPKEEKEMLQRIRQP